MGELATARDSFKIASAASGVNAGDVGVSALSDHRSLNAPDFDPATITCYSACGAGSWGGSVHGNSGREPTMNDTDSSQNGGADLPPIRELSKPQRRVFGTLVEKAYTVPESYPLTLKAVTAGCNQKS